MLKLLWFISQPHRDIEGFEDWYQSEHVAHGMRQELLQRFRINRSLLPAPNFVTARNGSQTPIAYRFSEGYWQTLEDMQHCYVSPNGRAALADGPANIRPAAAPPAPLPVLIVREEILPVERELCFNIRTGTYTAPLACKLFAFLRLPEGDAARFDTAYRALAEEVRKDADLRGHALGHVQDAVVRIGRVMQWPPAGSEHFDRTLEFYFESPDALDRFCAGPWMSRLQDATASAVRVAWAATRIQEVFYTSVGAQPLEDSWKSLYGSDGEPRRQAS